MKLTGNKILFIGTGFYKYDEAIRKELESNGASVYYFSSIRKFGYTEKVLYLRSKRKMSSVIDNEIKHAILNAPSDIDIVFSIKGENLNEFHIGMLQQKYPKAHTILYLWDSIVRLQNWEILKSYFKRISTFDRLDSLKYNIQFRPLFYTYSENNANIEEYPFEYDYSFVGEFHTDRYEIISKIKQLAIKNGKSYRFCIYTDWYGYLLNRYVYKRIKPEDKDIIITEKLSYKDYLQITRKSRAIIDIENPLQSGLTIRSLETLAQGKYLITTNPDIKNYDDIDATSYHVISRNDPSITNMDYSGTYARISNRYSIEGFINEIFSNYE